MSIRTVENLGIVRQEPELCYDKILASFFQGLVQAAWAGSQRSLVLCRKQSSMQPGPILHELQLKPLLLLLTEFATSLSSQNALGHGLITHGKYQFSVPVDCIQVNIADDTKPHISLLPLLGHNPAQQCKLDTSDSTRSYRVQIKVAEPSSQISLLCFAALSTMCLLNVESTLGVTVFC